MHFILMYNCNIITKGIVVMMILIIILIVVNIIIMIMLMKKIKNGNWDNGINISNDDKDYYDI